MNYPSINEYKEAILFAEDNFEQLKNLRPVLEEDGSPVMTSGNFAVVFKMKDEQTGKLHAVKCFLREQEGRAEGYRMIAEELEFVSSTFLTPIKYLDKELFVDTNAGDDTEFPVLLMDWVEGDTLDKYIRKHLDDQYELSLLAYQFSRLAMWLMPQPFAHGDLKPDNILVKSDGTLVLVDYDGMYVPAMKGQKARELGSPDFRHPSRTETDFDEHIDDFSLASILLSLKAISLQPSLLEEYGAQDRLLFSEKDYRNLSESKALDAIKDLMHDAELASLYSLFILAASQNNLSGVSFRLFYLNRPSVSSPKKSMRVLQINKKIVNQSNQKIIKKELLASFQGKKNVWHILLSNGTSSYLTQDWSFNYEASAKGACKLNTVENDKKHVLFLFNDRDAEVGRYYIGEKLRGLTPKQLTEIKHELCFFEAWNPETNKWVPCVGKSKESIRKQKLESEDQRIEVTDEELDAWAAAIEENLPHDNKRCWTLLEFAKAHGKMQVGEFQNKETGESFKSCIFTNPQDNSRVFVAFSYKLGALSPKEIAAMKDELVVVQLESGNYSLCRREQQKENLSTEVSDEDLSNAWTDAYGVIYSSDKKRLLKAPNNLKEYSILTGTKVICDKAFNWCEDEDSYVLTYNDTLESIMIPDTVIRIGNHAFRNCLVLDGIVMPKSLRYIGDHAFSGCKTLSKVNLPESVIEIGDAAFCGCEALTSINIPNSLSKLSNSVFSECAFSQISIPDTIKEIDNFAFYQCRNLRRVSVPNSIEKFGVGLFGGCSSLVEAELPNTLDELGYEFFSGCPLTHINIPNSVKIIRERAFWNSSIKHIVIPDSVKTIEAGAFYCCPLLSVTIPNSITKIEDETFYECFALKQVVIPNSVTEIGNLSFYSCAFTEILLPNSIVKIGNRAFNYCESLRKIDIPNSVEVIEDGAFANCYSLEAVSFPSSIKHLGDSLFHECDKLKHIYIPIGTKDKFVKLLPDYKDKLIEKSYILHIIFDNSNISKVERCHVYKRKEDWVMQVTFKNGVRIDHPYSLLQGNQDILLDKQSIEKLQMYIGLCERFYINPKAIEVDYESPSNFSAKILFNADNVEISGITWGLNNNINDWRVKGIRSFNIEERLAVSRAEIVASQYGNSVCFFMNAGGQTYIPLDKNSELTIGDELDMNTAKLITMYKKGKDDIVRVIE